MNSFLSIYPRETNTQIKVHSSFIHNNHNLETTHMPTQRRVDKHTVVDLHSEVLFSNRKEQIDGTREDEFQNTTESERS